ncbi:Gfo/Idh/MocA family oxidoreductase [Nocardia sp. NRRL S-836]|uniref:Gfo/Idh/MocA family protein n=1 Tax=Nocardia sp. NRRL S-836 TaxID=1519492 RepID=UPI0006AEC812|nr:Gfo/Idh/MocA family oxidoreductase [Nocardia sp. NRRL S-836]KOV79230.1 oxidoreductase [Nocardia sp. NRRL S-836]
MRTALVGYGLGGAAFHAPFISTTPGLELSAVVTANPQRQSEVRSRYPSTRLLSSLDEVWSGAFDLVVITTPNRFHATHARQVLEHGLNVVVDKPFAASAAEARALASIASSRDLMLVPFHNRRWDGDFRTVKSLLATNALGEVHRFESRFERYRPEIKSSWKESGDPADLGSILFDLGTHLIDQSVALFGRPLSVHAEIATVRPGAKADDDVFLALTHEAGVRSHLWMSALAADQGPRFRVLGHDAAYVKYGMDPQEERLKAGETPGGPGWGEEPESAWGTLGGQPHRTEPGAYQHFYASIAAGVAPVSPQDAVTGLEVIEAAKQSAITGDSVRL